MQAVNVSVDRVVYHMATTIANLSAEIAQLKAQNEALQEMLRVRDQDKSQNVASPSPSPNGEPQVVSSP